MLVLGRKQGEGIRIEHPLGSIRVSVVRISSGAVRLGIEADKEIGVTREELVPGQLQTQEENNGHCSVVVPHED